MKVRVPITRITSKLSDEAIAGLTPAQWEKYSLMMQHKIQKHKANNIKKIEKEKAKLTESTKWRDRGDIVIEKADLLRKEEEERLEQERQEKYELRLEEEENAKKSATGLAQSRSIAKQGQDIQNRKSNILGIQFSYVLAMAEPSYLNKDEIIRRDPATKIYKDRLDEQFTDKKREIIDDRSLDAPDVLDEVEVRFKEYLDSEYKNRTKYTDMYDRISRDESNRNSDKRVADEIARHHGRGGSQ
jgi:hypothetical protein